MTPHDAPLRPDDHEAVALNTFLDTLVSGAPFSTTYLEPGFASPVRRIHDYSDAQIAPRLTRTESNQLWEDLMQSHLVPPALSFPGASRRSPAARDDHVDPVAASARHREARLRLVGSAGASGAGHPALIPGSNRSGSRLRRWTRHGWPIVELLGVAALIIGLVSVIMGGFGGDDGRPAVIPMAGVGTATPMPDQDEIAAMPDPGQTGVMPGPGIDGQPELVWRIPIQGVTDGLFVSDGTIVRSHFSDEIPTEVPITNNPWYIEALSARAGTPIWETEVEASGAQIGGVWEGSVVLVASGGNVPVSIGGEDIGAANQGYVISLDLATGAVNWSTLLATASSTMANLNGLVLSGGVAYVSTAAGQLSAIDLRDGSITWSVTIDDVAADQMTAFPLSGISVSEGVLAIYSMETGKVYTFDAGTGELNWSLQVADPPTQIPVEGSEGIFTTSNVPSVSTPAIADGRMYLTVSSYSDDAPQSLMAIDLKTGKELWTTDLGSIDLTDPARQLGVGQPYVTDDAVIVSTGGPDGNRLIASSTETGDQLWERKLSDEQSSMLSIVGDTGYVASVDGSLTGIDLQTGDQLWSVETGGSLHAAPSVVDGMLYQAADDGQLYALGAGGMAESTPGARANISGLPGCDVEPREPAADVFAMAAERTPAATLVEPVAVGVAPDTFLTAPTLAWDDLPIGTPASSDVATAIQQTVDGITICSRTGDQAQVAAYYTDDYFSRPYNLGVAEFSDGYFPSSEIPVMSGDLRVLNDGRVGMIATEGLISREIGQNQATLYLFAEQPDGQWLIDEVVIVNNSGEAPQG